jgi:hypothetical protein
MGSVVWTIPLQLTADAATSIAVVSLKVKE